jgi:hypothetical protein
LYTRVAVITPEDSVTIYIPQYPIAVTDSFTLLQNTVIISEISS